MERENKIDFDFNDFREEGLYLIFPDSSRMALTRDHVQKVTREYWANPRKIPEEVKNAVDFQRCPFCPLKGQDDFCDALRPILPFFEVMDKYVSFDKVTAVYRDAGRNLFHIADTNMQNALRFVSIMSLMQYCQIGRKYWRYYLGISPLAAGPAAVERLFLNIYWDHKGDMARIRNTISAFNGQIEVTADNQIKRLNLICKNDAFMNAFVNTHTMLILLDLDVESSLARAFDEFEKQMPL